MLKKWLKAGIETECPVSNERRHATGGIAHCDSEHDTGWPGNEAARSLPARDQARSQTVRIESPPDPIRRRFVITGSSKEQLENEVKPSWSNS